MVMLAEFSIVERLGIWIILVGVPLLACWLVELAQKDKKGGKK